MNTKPDIEINIDQLVLHGFSTKDKLSIGKEIRRELTFILTNKGAPGLLKTGGFAPYINGGSFESNPGASPGSIGKSVARNIYAGLKGS